ncbi:MAG: NAD(P)/FAD-dependent oxidoreductase [Thermodesulfobacteriota bacterium]
MSLALYDVAIIGGGVMGSSVAYHLLRLEPKIKVAVVERDPTYAHSSSALSLGGIRVQFSLRENIQMSLYALERIKNFAEEMAVDDEKPFLNFCQEGYLFLINAEGKKEAEESLKRQRQLSAKVEWWSAAKIKDTFPLLSGKDFVGGTYGPQDGYLDPYALLMAFRKKAISLGAYYIIDEVKQILRSSSAIEGILLGSGKKIISKTVVNAAGAWAADIASSVGVELPIRPISRQVFAVKPALSIPHPFPLVIAPSGLYFRPETGGLMLVGRSLPEDKVGYDFTWTWARFQNILWPELAEIVSSFSHLKLVRGWSGLYDQNLLDSNAILGPWPELPGLFLINGFSGHGLQQSFAAGRYLSELVLNINPTLDLCCFSPQRILENHPLSEGGIV